MLFGEVLEDDAVAGAAVLGIEFAGITAGDSTIAQK